jgi:hypothetical protein
VFHLCVNMKLPRRLLIEKLSAKLKSSNLSHFAPTNRTAFPSYELPRTHRSRLTMTIPEIGIMPDREMTLASVRFGDISPSMAAKWIGDIEFEPIPSFPNIAAFDPMQEEKWTLPMAAAWFIWRSTDAVRDQWIRYRRA